MQNCDIAYLFVTDETENLCADCLGCKMNVYKESPGVYFENLGHTTLSDSVWTRIVYVPMQPIDNETSNLE